ncbi:hypothetical protein M0812_17609 [Anaeramoeba flamelloides]|uniref:Uncharacterized protein n=1 Tax=Anaeramoeba flamelloides TaxID=1746091 RepID=A0AAV7ZDJ3_9EUKA|nr:hypothetical protein M0812_17609 [Anaeramoeba flamelloides]|eukprot:Anaeramoba_flamelloidesa811256_89.p1 GENE.a811256_89~~a811256_89.p1  ORF type:complete len:288 (+),score=66.42 a811256_89:52-915(+)
MLNEIEKPNEIDYVLTKELLRERRGTKNQLRVNYLINMEPKVIWGINQKILDQINSPQEIYLHSNIVHEINECQENMNIDKTYKMKITDDDLDYFMLKQYNLSRLKSKNENWILFGLELLYPSNSNILTQQRSEDFYRKQEYIRNRLIKLYQTKSQLIKGLSEPQLSTEFQIPVKIIIDKNAIHKLCTKKINRQKEIRKIERGLISFFRARFNLINKTNFNRLYMVFNQNLYTPSLNKNRYVNQPKLKKRRRKIVITPKIKAKKEQDHLEFLEYELIRTLIKLKNRL